MLGPIARKYMFKGYFWGALTSFTPFEYDPERDRYFVTRKKLKLLNWFMNTSYCFYIIAWLGVRAVQLAERQEESDLDRAYYMLGNMFLVFMFFPTALQLNFIRAKHELPSFAYDFIQFGTDFQEEYVLPEELARQQSARYDKSGYIIASLWYLQLIVFNDVSVLLFLIPELPVSATGAFYDYIPSILIWPASAVQAFLIAAYLLTLYGNQCIYCFPASEYLFGLLYMTREMNLDRESYTTTRRLRTPEHFVQVYRSLEVLHAKAKFIYEPVVLPVNEWSYVALASYGIFGAIRIRGMIGILMGTAAFLGLYYLFTFFTVMSLIYRESSSMLESWKRRNKGQQPKWLRKSLESMRPMRLCVGGAYFIDPSMILNMYRSVFEGTVDLLMLG